MELSPIPSDKIRNIAIVGQTGSGKTSLVEAMNHFVNKTSRMGRIEDGNTVSDFEPEEIKHRHSISLSVISLEYQGFKINLLDTPGVVDFAGEVQAALYACDLALFVVSATEALSHDTVRIWQSAQALNKPRMCFINKVDKERADFSSTVERLSQTFGEGIAPIEIPLGEAEKLSGVIDLFSETVASYVGNSASTIEIPPEIAISEHRAHELLIEGIVVADEEMTAAYLDGVVPDKAALEAVMASGIRDSTVFPVVVGSALKGIGIDRLVDFLIEIAPAPESSSSSTIRARIYKTYSDPFLGRLSLMKVLSGTISVDTDLLNTRTGTSERLHSIFMLSGKEHLNQASASCGDIIAVAKLNSVRTGDVLSSSKTPAQGEAELSFEVPMLRYQIVPDSKADEEKLSNALAKLNEEEPTISIARDPRTHNLILSGLGELQLSTVLEKLTRRYQLKASLRPCEVEYLETIAKPVQVEGKYKKQSGGHGQFGVARLRFAPLERGSGVKFVDQIVGGAIPRQFIPAVEKGVIEACDHGGLHGYPVVDIEAHLYDGSFHSVDSSEMSFKMAGILALREAITQASTTVLEPIMHLAVTVPTRQQGDVLGDLSSRRAKVTRTELDDQNGAVTIMAVVPANEIQSYASELRSLTAGQGKFSAVYNHHDPLPKALYSRLAKASGS